LLASLPCREIVSVSPPFTAVVAAKGIVGKRFSDIRWIIDLGDPFSLCPESPPNNYRVYARLNSSYERKCFAHACAIVVTNEEMRRLYAEAFPESAGKIVIVPPLLPRPPAQYREPPATNISKKRLVFVGKLYGSLRRPDFLLRLFAQATRSGFDAELHFYGDVHECDESFRQYRKMLPGKLFLHGPVSHSMAIEAMRSATVLINIGNDTAYQLPSKLTEYVATGKPIINLTRTPNDSSAWFLKAHPGVLNIIYSHPEPRLEDVETFRDFVIAARTSLRRGVTDDELASYGVGAISAQYRSLLGGDSN